MSRTGRTHEVTGSVFVEYEDRFSRGTEVQAVKEERSQIVERFASALFTLDRSDGSPHFPQQEERPRIGQIDAARVGLCSDVRKHAVRELTPGNAHTRRG